jgi:hypothetical protein
LIRKWLLLAKTYCVASVIESDQHRIEARPLPGHGLVRSLFPLHLQRVSEQTLFHFRHRVVVTGLLNVMTLRYGLHHIAFFQNCRIVFERVLVLPKTQHGKSENLGYR